MTSQNGDLYASDPEACLLYENGYVNQFRKIANDAIAKYYREEA